MEFLLFQQLRWNSLKWFSSGSFVFHWTGVEYQNHAQRRRTRSQNSIHYRISLIYGRCFLQKWSTTDFNEGADHWTITVFKCHFRFHFIVKRSSAHGSIYIERFDLRFSIFGFSADVCFWRIHWLLLQIWVFSFSLFIILRPKYQVM